MVSDRLRDRSLQIYEIEEGTETKIEIQSFCNQNLIEISPAAKHDGSQAAIALARCCHSSSNAVNRHNLDALLTIRCAGSK